ncbi:MAG: YihY family inner membrane protein [Gammaproteobacteria bacterium]|jgi:membrane protein|nr:YihY family inner membrane protein [Xanthomonadales bacterium]
MHKWDTFKRFYREVFRQFFENETPLSASSLAYTTLLSLVPFMAVVVTVFSAFPHFEDVSGQIQDFIFDNFVPTAGEVVQEYITGFVEKSRNLKISMALAIFVTSILMMHTMEKALNRIWDTKPSGNLLKKIVMYWTVLTMGPILVGGGIALTSVLFNYEGFNTIKIYVLKVLPVLASTFGFFLIYLVVPNRKVKWKSALIGAITAAILFEMAKRGFAWYVATFPSYQRVYGTLATIPIFLLWVYLSWNIVLLGGTIAATLETSRWRYRVQSYTGNHRFLVITFILYRLWQASKKGETVSLTDFFNQMDRVPDVEIYEQLNWLEENKMIQTNQEGDYVLLRDMDSISIGKLYTMGRFSLPFTTTEGFEFFEPFIQQIWSKIHSDMKNSVKTVFKQIEKENEK